MEFVEILGPACLETVQYQNRQTLNRVAENHLVVGEEIEKDGSLVVIKIGPLRISLDPHITTFESGERLLIQSSMASPITDRDPRLNKVYLIGDRNRLTLIKGNTNPN